MEASEWLLFLQSLCLYQGCEWDGWGKARVDTQLFLLPEFFSPVYLDDIGTVYTTRHMLCIRDIACWFLFLNYVTFAPQCLGVCCALCTEHHPFTSSHVFWCDKIQFIHQADRLSLVATYKNHSQAPLDLIVPSSRLPKQGGIYSLIHWSGVG